MTTQNAARHPSSWPTSVASGAPAQVESVSPTKVAVIAVARRSGATRSAAMTALRPNTAPWGSAVTTRATKSVPKPGAERGGEVPQDEERHEPEHERAPGQPGPERDHRRRPTTTPPA